MSFKRWQMEVIYLKRRLSFACKFLLIAALVQLSIFAPVHGDMGNRIFGFTVFVSAFFAAIGFIIVVGQLNLLAEALDESRLRWRFKLPLMLGFLVAFLVPLVNLAIIFWTYAKARSAVRELDALAEDEARKEKIRDQFRSC